MLKHKKNMALRCNAHLILIYTRHRRLVKVPFSTRVLTLLTLRVELWGREW